MRISDWSSDVCSSDLTGQRDRIPTLLIAACPIDGGAVALGHGHDGSGLARCLAPDSQDPPNVGLGTRAARRNDLVGCALSLAHSYRDQSRDRTCGVSCKSL